MRLLTLALLALALTACGTTQTASSRTTARETVDEPPALEHRRIGELAVLAGYVDIIPVVAPDPEHPDAETRYSVATTRFLESRCEVAMAGASNDLDTASVRFAASRDGVSQGTIECVYALVSRIVPDYNTYLPRENAEALFFVASEAYQPLVVMTPHRRITLAPAPGGERVDLVITPRR